MEDCLVRIFDFAVVLEWEQRLTQLALLAEPERWTYVSVPRNVSMDLRQAG